MISVLLILLKIIGITFLVIIGILLFALILVLFVPVRYRFSGSYEGTFRCKGKVTWLLHFISFRLEIEENVIKDLRILGIPASFFMGKKKNRRAEKNQEISGQEMASDSDSMNKEGGGFGTDSVLSNPATAEQSVTEQSKTESAIVDFWEKVDSSDSNKKKSIVQKVLDKMNEAIDRVKKIYQKILDFIGNLKDFIINIKGKKKTLDRYKKILKSETFKAAFSLCKKQILKVLKHILPGKMMVNITYGLDDPANTGYILGVYGMLPGFIGERIVLHPDFDHSVFYGDFYVKGRIRGWTVLHSVLYVITDKNCKKLFHVVKKEIANERK